jgi:hypothetical protein
MYDTEIKSHQGDTSISMACLGIKRIEAIYGYLRVCGTASNKDPHHLTLLVKSLATYMSAYSSVTDANNSRPLHTVVVLAVAKLISLM